jgi:hypothetical protein
MLSARKSTKAGARKGASSRSASPALDAAAATRSVEQQPASDARDEQQQQQQQQQEQQDNGASRQYLILTVHEARNLVACDYSTHSSDACVWLGPTLLVRCHVLLLACLSLARHTTLTASTSCMCLCGVCRAPACVRQVCEGQPGGRVPQDAAHPPQLPPAVGAAVSCVLALHHLA